MAIVICPECSKQISQYAESCSECGFPLKKFMDNHNITDIDSVLICPICANIYFGYEKEYFPPHIKCKFCNNAMVQTNEDTKKTFHLFCNSDDEMWQQNIISLAKKYGNNQFSEEAYQHRLAMIKQENNASKEIDIKPSTPQVTCPYCKSTDTKKISTTKRAGSILGLGILSKKIGKQWHCNNCKSDF